jgi:hypothetical protein
VAIPGKIKDSLVLLNKDRSFRETLQYTSKEDLVELYELMVNYRTEICQEMTFRLFVHAFKL